jgi:YidC/Oxa1 family membrane protein insertase
MSKAAHSAGQPHQQWNKDNNMWDLLILNPMINALLLIYDFLGDNFGVAIIIFTALIRLITFPLTYRQQVGTQKMQELQKSKQKLQEETMKLYQEAGINPLSGCLPLLIQLPIIFGLYQAIIQALADAPLQLLEFSKHIYSFVSSTLIPLNSQFLWMNLGQPERLYLDFLPGIGIPVLTILVVITSWMQTKLTTPPSPEGQGGQMSQMMTIYSPLLMGYLAYSFASGLALYFFVSNLLGILQYAATGRINWRNLVPFRKQE